MKQLLSFFFATFLALSGYANETSDIEMPDAPPILDLSDDIEMPDAPPIDQVASQEPVTSRLKTLSVLGVNPKELNLPLPVPLLPSMVSVESGDFIYEISMIPGKTPKDIYEKWQKISQQKIDFTPEKAKPCWISLDSYWYKDVDPRVTLTKLKKGAGIRVVEAENVQIIKAHDIYFTQGMWIFLDIGDLTSYVLVDCDNPFWAQFSSHFISSLNPNSIIAKNPLYFIGAILARVWNDLEYMAENLYFEPDFKEKTSREELVCRHQATLLLPVFSYVLTEPGKHFRGVIRLATADQIGYADCSGKEWVRLGGHVWNVVTLMRDPEDESDTGEEHFLVDLTLQFIVWLGRGPSKSDEIMALTGQGIEHAAYPADSIVHEMIELTKRMFNLIPNKGHIMGDMAAMEVAAAKTAICNSWHPAACTFILQPNNVEWASSAESADEF